MIAIIAAYAKNRVIGKGNELPWYIPEDLKRFKEITSGHTVIMGRRTHESIVARLGHSLPNRRNIVLSGSHKNLSSDIESASSLQAALRLTAGDGKVFIIGGERVFKEALEAGVVDKIYATEIDSSIDGDRYFPNLDENKWRAVNVEDHHNSDFRFRYVTYERNR